METKHQLSATPDDAPTFPAVVTAGSGTRVSCRPLKYENPGCRMDFFENNNPAAWVTDFVPGQYKDAATASRWISLSLDANVPGIYRSPADSQVAPCSVRLVKRREICEYPKNKLAQRRKILRRNVKGTLQWFSR
jgi:hypothetical protein